MKKILFTTSLLVTLSLGLAACTAPSMKNDSDLEVPDAKQTTIEETSQVILPSSTDTDSLEKDLGSMKLEDETFQ